MCPRPPPASAAPRPPCSPARYSPDRSLSAAPPPAPAPAPDTPRRTAAPFCIFEAILSYFLNSPSGFCQQNTPNIPRCRRIFRRKKLIFPPKSGKSACCLLVLHTESAPAAYGPGRCNSPDSRREALPLPVVALPSHRRISAMAEFPPGGEFRRFRRLLALTVPVAQGLSPFLFHRCLPPKGSRGAAVTPDQQAVYSDTWYIIRARRG